MIPLGYNNFIDYLSSSSSLDFSNIIKKALLELEIDISQNHIFSNLLPDYFEIIPNDDIIEGLFQSISKFVKDDCPVDSKKRWELLILKISNNIYHRINKANSSEIVGLLFLEICRLIKITDRSGLNLNREINPRHQTLFRPLVTDSCIQERTRSISNLFYSDFTRIFDEYRERLLLPLDKESIARSGDDDDDSREKAEFFDMYCALELIPLRIKKKSLHFVSAIILHFMMHCSDVPVSGDFDKLSRMTNDFVAFEIDANMDYIKWIMKSENYWNQWIKQGAAPSFEKSAIALNPANLEMINELSTYRQYAIKSEFRPDLHLKFRESAHEKSLYNQDQSSYSWIEYRKRRVK